MQDTNSTVCVGQCVQCQGEIEALKETNCFWCVRPLCWLCWEKTYGQCSRCARTISKTDEAARMSYARHVHRGGRPKKMRKCLACGVRFCAREMRTHKCAKN